MRLASVKAYGRKKNSASKLDGSYNTILEELAIWETCNLCMICAPLYREHNPCIAWENDVKPFRER
jgi:hypothetical protein